MVETLDSGISITSVPMVECSRHGVFVRTDMTVWMEGQEDFTTYTYCPYCWGEWLVAFFPVKKLTG